MNPIALLAGIIIALAILIRFKQRGLERIRWVYPLYYWQHFRFTILDLRSMLWIQKLFSMKHS